MCSTIMVGVSTCATIIAAIGVIVVNVGTAIMVAMIMGAGMDADMIAIIETAITPAIMA